MTSNINSTINRALNAGASALESIVYFNFLPSTILGAAGGWLVGVGPKMGLFQGLSTYVFYASVIKPGSKYVNANIGDAPDKINDNTREVLALIGAIAGFAIPILVTKKVGPRCIKSLDPYMPKWKKTIVGTEPTTELAAQPITQLAKQPKEYTLFRGVLVNIAPATVQYGIEFARELNAKSK
jgi:hypothetical protein